MQVQYYTQADRTIIAAPTLNVAVAERLLGHRQTTRSEPSPSLPGRGTVQFIQHDNKTYVLRHYHRGGLYGRIIKDSYFHRGIKQTRPWCEWHLLHSLHQQGLPVPRPVVCLIQRHGLFYRGDMVTEAIPQSQPLSQLLTQAPLSNALWSRIGSTIRTFHNSGIYHADLNAHNILIDAQQAVWLIDFDRGYRRTPRSAWQQRNLKRLHRSLTKLQHKQPFHFDEANWRSLIDAYH